MNDEFYDWLNDCPVQWYRDKVTKEGINYFFEIPDDEDDVDIEVIKWC